MNGVPFSFEASVVARTPSGDVLIALFGRDGEAVVLTGSVDAALNLVAGIAESLVSDNGTHGGNGAK